MVGVVSAVSIIAYIISLIKFNKEYLEQQVVFLIIYLIGLTIVGKMDILLPMYFVVSVLPFLRCIRRITIFTAVISLYFGLYLLYGIIYQNITGTFVTFIAKMWQFIIFFIVFDSDIKLIKENIKKIIWMAVITETILGLYLLATSTNIDASGLARLVSNSQPITGNISTVVLPISVYYYLINKENSKQTGWLLAVNMVMLIWIVLSGTRGYTLEFVSTMILVFYDYFTNRYVDKVSQTNRKILLSLLLLIITMIIIVTPRIFEGIESILRLRSSIGIRSYENAVIMEFISNAPLITILFGIGLGGQGGSYSVMNVALYRQFSFGMWDRNHYLSDSGALFHNLYANILMCLGIIGSVLIVLMNMSIWKRITQSCGSLVQARRIMHLFQVSFLFMNYYRWSADCGISEMIILAIILKILQNENKGEYNE